MSDGAVSKGNPNTFAIFVYVSGVTYIKDAKKNMLTHLLCTVAEMLAVKKEWMLYSLAEMSLQNIKRVEIQYK